MSQAGVPDTCAKTTKRNAICQLNRGTGNIFFYFFFRGANKNGGTDRMKVGHAREERYAHEAEATTLELALVFRYARELSLIMRRTSLKGTVKRATKMFNQVQLVLHYCCNTS